MGAPLGHTVHPHQRLPREEEGYVERGAQAHVAGEDGQGDVGRGRGRGWMRMSERVGWSMSSCLSRGLNFLARVYWCLCVCMWLEDSVALVRILDSPLAGSVATVVFPWRHCHLLLH